MGPSEITRLWTPRAEWVALVAQQDHPTSKEHRRRHPRLVFAGLAKIAYERFDGTPQVDECAVLNVSDEGLMLRGRSRVPPEELVAVELDMGWEVFRLRGQVIHCTQTVAAYKIGIKLMFSEPAAKDPSTG